MVNDKEFNSPLQGLAATKYLTGIQLIVEIYVAPDPGNLTLSVIDTQV